MIRSEIPQISQASLQDYDDCRRRYYYRFVLRQSWPADEAQPALGYEKFFKSGKDFHSLLHQYLSGVPVDLLEKSDLIQGELETWWNHFRDLEIHPGKDRVFPEKLLSTRIDETKLIAKFDLVVVYENNDIRVFDWKTNKRKPSRGELASRWQTRVYLYTLASSGGFLLKNAPVDPEKLSMIYWFANFPSGPIEFNYSKALMKEDMVLIRGLIDDIKTRNGIDSFELTDNTKMCKYCVYRSLCDRGAVAGLHPEIGFESSVDISLDFDEIEEIAF